ncbi:MAG: type II secretion system protein GspE, partial [Candidatus Omnitrophica bacterium]|nr:type II secretion system protein GspE [Candidatus Omnitrophota bacterium]
MILRRVIHKQLGELLVERKVITSQQLEKAIAVQKEKGGLIGEILVELGFAKEEDIAQALTAQYGFPFLPLSNYEINPEIIKLIPLRVAKQYLLIPIDKIGNNITLAMS